MLSTSLFSACNHQESKNSELNEPDTFKYLVEQFADLKVLRYKIPGFESMNIKQKKLMYYLSQAALAGRDITWDQNGKYNLLIRKTLENILETYSGNRSSIEFKKFEIYTKRVWFSNGIYHHYSTDKIAPDFSPEYFDELIRNSKTATFVLPKEKSISDVVSIIKPVIFDPNIYPKRVWQDPSRDLVTNSAANFYHDVTEKEVEEYYKKLKDPNDLRPISYGLNSRLVKENGTLVEKLWKSGGLYGSAIDEIIKWLEKASTVAENNQQKEGLEKLITYYKSGDLKIWDDYNINWATDTASQVDYVNGFIEVYGDPLGLRGGWEAIVNFRNEEATERTLKLSNNAQWFENNSPTDKRFKKEKVKGISAKVITVAQLGGECHPATPIGINLPNADWIRKEYGSKSVTIENITHTYNQVLITSGFYEEFIDSKNELEYIRLYKSLSDNLHVDLHECLGHGSGQLLPGVNTDIFKNYYSTLEETRADLFALYYIMDPKMVELGILPNLDAAKAEYYYQILNGLLTQLVRIEPGKNIEEAHMRNRQLIAKWCYEMGKKDNVIEFYKKNNKTYLRINNYDQMRKLLGELLAEVQRIKSEGDYEACKALIENYGVIVDQALLTEARERYAKLNLAPYSGFINPVLMPVEKDGEIIDIKVEYPTDYSKQMLEYGKKFSFLPVIN
jgi:dipeptidyl-peptidase-3